MKEIISSTSPSNVPPPSGVVDIAFGASTGVTIGAVAGVLVATGASLPITFPFVLAGAAGVIGGASAAYLHNKKTEKDKGEIKSNPVG